MTKFCVLSSLLLYAFLAFVAHSQDDDDFTEFLNPDEATVAEEKDEISPSSYRQEANNMDLPAYEDFDDYDNSGEDDTVNPMDSEFEQDNEEFEGYVKPHKESDGGSSDSVVTSETDKNGKPELKIAKTPNVFRSWDKYTLELFLLALIFVYLVNFIIGRGTNSRLAKTWFDVHKELFESNFALVGDDGQAEPGTATLVQESESLYSLWCSGRVCCEGMLIELRLLKRQDLFSVILNWLKPASDSVVVKIVMEDGEMDGWVLAVGQKRILTTLAKEHFDLATFPMDRRGQRYAGIPEHMLILSEIPEATTALLNGTVCKLITDYHSSIEYLYFSDQYSGPRMPNEDMKPPKPEQVQKVLIFSFVVGSKGVTTPEDMEAMKPLFNFVFYMIDKARRIRLVKESKARSEKARSRVNETLLKSVHAQRQENAQNRRDEQRRATKERIMAEEDPEKARKLEEKEQRKEGKRKQRMKMMKVKGM